jgi:hypothetical protein
MTSDPHDVVEWFGISIVPRHRYVPAGRTVMVTEQAVVIPSIPAYRYGAADH